MPAALTGRGLSWAIPTAPALPAGCCQRAIVLLRAGTDRQEPDPDADRQQPGGSGSPTDLDRVGQAAPGPGRTGLWVELVDHMQPAWPRTPGDAREVGDAFAMHFLALPTPTNRPAAEETAGGIEVLTASGYYVEGSYRTVEVP